MRRTILYLQIYVRPAKLQVIAFLRSPPQNLELQEEKLMWKQTHNPPFDTMGGYSMDCMSLVDTMMYLRGSYNHRFVTLDECTKEYSWENTWIIMIIVDEETLEAGEYLLTPNKIPSQLSSNMEDSEICGHSQAHKRRNDQVVVHQGFIGTE